VRWRRLGTILLRRPNELGGNRTYAKATAGLFVGLWARAASPVPLTLPPTCTCTCTYTYTYTFTSRLAPSRVRASRLAPRPATARSHHHHHRLPAAQLVYVVLSSLSAYKHIVVEF
jgi:hypothetical protein